MSYVATPGEHSNGLTHFYGESTDRRNKGSFFLELHFQDGPINDYGTNGTTNEEVIQLLIERIQSLNTMDNNKFSCKENSCAITKLEEALHWLNARTNVRIKRGVEGSNIP